MFKTSCPSCGAPVSFRSAASIMAVCAYCNSTLLKDGDAVKDAGKMGTVLEDYSRIQIPTSGIFNGAHFTVVGRIQLRYDDGFWNEWYALFDDGKGGWLSDASGQYVFTQEVQGNPRTPAFEQFKPGKPFISDGKAFYASDVRTAQCTAGEGELPFKVDKGYQARVVDLRCGDAFMTLDYSDDTYHVAPKAVDPMAPLKLVDQPVPKQYLGRAVTLEEMRCQLLRDDDTIKDKAGAYPGKVQPLDCPNCGNSIPYVPGLAAQLICPSCHTPVDATSSKAEALMAVDTMEQVKPTLPLGAEGTLDGVRWQVLGAMAQTGDGEAWGEYLLFNAAQGFLWLIELGDGTWQKCHVLNVWPDWTASSLRYQNHGYSLLYRYEARVAYAAGAFNWRVKAGDVESVKEYGSGSSRLAMEWNEQEINWSASEPLAIGDLHKAFGDLQGGWLSSFGVSGGSSSVAMPSAPLEYHASSETTTRLTPQPLKGIAYFFTVVFFFLNATYMDGSGFIVMLAALAILWIPVLFSGAIET